MILENRPQRTQNQQLAKTMEEAHKELYGLHEITKKAGTAQSTRMG